MNIQELQDIQEAIKESGLPVSEVVKFIKHGPRMEKLIRRAYYWQAETLQESKPDDTTITGELLYMMHKLEEADNGL